MDATKKLSYVIYIPELKERKQNFMKLYKLPDGKANISGTKIKEIRESLGLSQEQLAARVQLAGLSLTQKAISRIETGERVVPDFELIVFSEVLKTSIYTLLLMEQHSTQTE